MECPHCKEEIKEGAKKCKVCGEILGSRGMLKNLTSILGGLLSILIPVGSLFIAYLEHQGRVRAVDEKEIVERDKEATEDVLRDISIESISNAAEDKLKPKGEPRFETILTDEESQGKLEEIENLISEGNKVLESGDVDKAEQFYHEAATLEREQQIPETHVPKALGYIYLRKGEYKKAIQEFEKALERDPEDMEARKGLIYAETLAKKQIR